MSRLHRALALTVGALLPLGTAIVWTSHAPWTAVSTADGIAGDGTREIAVRVHAWGFSPSVVRVAPGEHVRFVVRTDDIKHGFAINELGLNLQLRPGAEVRSPAVGVDLPDGTYTIHCSAFCGLGHPAMKAKLVVGAPRREPGNALPWIASAAALVLAAGFVAIAGAAGGRLA
ncbi:MAG: cupredoxin domain-containing protein [Candidatus Rokubacteria bacterium]|nr:cupredoxin domain-containing protein [Candidatus Rokubacteria bacterium]